MCTRELGEGWPTRALPSAELRLAGWLAVGAEPGLAAGATCGKADARAAAPVLLMSALSDFFFFARRAAFNYKIRGLGRVRGVFLEGGV